MCVAVEQQSSATLPSLKTKLHHHLLLMLLLYFMVSLQICYEFLKDKKSDLSNTVPVR